MHEDRLLVARVLKGDAFAFRDLVEGHQRLVNGMVGRLVREPGAREDLCQEIFMQVYRNLHRFDFRSRLSTWIARIAYLQAINYVRRQRRDWEVLSAELPELAELADGPEERFTRKELSAYIGRLIGRLPPVYQSAINLYYLEEFSLLEISQITGLPEGTLKSQLFRARSLLKEGIEGYIKKELR